MAVGPAGQLTCPLAVSMHARGHPCLAIALEATWTMDAGRMVVASLQSYSMMFYFLLNFMRLLDACTR